ncbi:MAG: SBBP repeat-containing protein [Pirellulales bacterium]|nr:SBBP repeat-containing protein [Pirellulales bacterium]
MLSVVGSGEAIEVFHAQDALFAENAGQWANEEIAFGYNQGGTQIYFTDDSIEFGLSRREAGEDGGSKDPLGTNFLPGHELEDEIGSHTSTRFSLQFDGARPTRPTGSDRAETVFNYHVGAPTNWVDGVATYKTVVYSGLYDGIDLHTFSRHGQMKYEFHVQPGADYSQISLSYTGIKGLSVDSNGRLHITTALGDLVDDGLYIYQVIDGQQVEVSGQFSLLDADTYTFTLTSDYDSSFELVIDPDLDWSTYLGGDIWDRGYGVAVDATGNIFATGLTGSVGWVSGGYDLSHGGSNSDVFVAKLSPGGSHLWSTYSGGIGNDQGYDIAVDSLGNSVLTGITSSPGWVSGGYDMDLEDSADAFVVKLAPDGAHIWSTYIGGSEQEIGQGIALDGLDNILVTGLTYTPGWVSGGYDTSYGDGHGDGFVAKLSTDGAFLWSTYLGGSGQDDGHAIAVDESGNVLVTGETGSSSVWVSGGYDTSYGGGGRDAFAVKLGPDGAHLWSTYLGGSSIDYCRGIAVDTSGNALLTGWTFTSGWMSGGYDTSLDGGSDAFVVKLSPEGNHLWSTYVGGDDYDWDGGIAVDALGNALVTGLTNSSGWTSEEFDTSFSGFRDGFVLKLNPSGEHVWSAYLGQTGVADSITVDAAGNILVVGETESSGWALGGYDTSYGGSTDAFVVRITLSPRLPGDADDSGTVDAADAHIVANHWMMQEGATWDQGDFNRDGRVDDLDASIMAANWGRSLLVEGVPAETPAAPAGPRVVGPRWIEAVGLLAPVRGELGLVARARLVVEGAAVRARAHDVAMAQALGWGSSEKIISPERRKIGPIERTVVDWVMMER